MNLVAVAIGELLVAALASDRNLAGVQLLNVNAQIGLSAASRRAHLALKNWLLSNRMDHLVCLQRVGLGEACVTNLA